MSEEFTTLCGDAATMMKAHIPDRSIQLAVADPAWLLRIPDKPTSTDYCYEKFGMSPRSRPEWDRFQSAASYCSFTQRWVEEVMRCLTPTGSLFIMGGYRSIGLVSYVLQMADINIVQKTVVTRTNGRPTCTHPGLMISHYDIMWATARPKGYRFNRMACERASYLDDPFNCTAGTMMRDSWFIQVADSRHTKIYAAKDLAVYERILLMCGKPGCMFLDLYSGSGTGAVAALKYGMACTSIDDDPVSVRRVIQRVSDDIGQGD